LTKLFEQIPVYSGLVVKTFEVGASDDFHEVYVTSVVFGKYELVIPQLVFLGISVKASVASHIKFTAKDRFDTSVFAGNIKFVDAIHGSVVS
jgi:hypothetical protein